jgi:protein tyrosine phosphatase (PTP) superfamily phosphohydrolase (DUF442 family)
MNDSGFSDIYNYRRVSERIATGGQPTAAQLSAVAQGGCQVVINLALHEGEDALPDEREQIQSLGMQYIHIPVVWQSPQPEDLLRFCETLARLEGQALFVHCVANVRVSVFVALDRIIRQGYPPDTALNPLDHLHLPPVWRRFIERMVTVGPQLWAERQQG